MKGRGLLAGLLGLAAIAAAGPAAAQQQIRLMYTATNSFCAAFVAQEQGFFKKRGVDVEFVLTASSGNNPPALVGGSVEVAGPVAELVSENPLLKLTRRPSVRPRV